jgi:hypothetical protein
LAQPATGTDDADRAIARRERGNDSFHLVDRPGFNLRRRHAGSPDRSSPARVSGDEAIIDGGR